MFATHWCGPGGAGSTVDSLDVACRAHDACYAKNNHLTAASNFNPFPSATELTALRQCNQALCTAALTSGSDNYGAPYVYLYFTAFLCVRNVFEVII